MNNKYLVSIYRYEKINGHYPSDSDLIYFMDQYYQNTDISSYWLNYQLSELTKSGLLYLDNGMYVISGKGETFLKRNVGKIHIRKMRETLSAMEDIQ